MGLKWPVAFVVAMFLSIAGLKGQLEVGFYDDKCLLAESVVKGVVAGAFVQDSGIAAGLVRMHFHDCFVRGCDGSILLDSVPPIVAEKDSPVNNPSLRGFEVIDRAKATLETLCSGVVSCADILAFAARDVVELSGGLGYEVPAGRRDGRISLASETATLPGPTLDLNQLTQAFANKGLTQEEMVILSGAHTIGRAHCTSISRRLYNFSTTLSQDPSIDPAYAGELKEQCPKGSNDPTLAVPMNPSSPRLLDNDYYKDILANRGLFLSDQALSTDDATLAQVVMHADLGAVWNIRFAQAMAKMGQIGVLTGEEGEIRSNCRRPN